MKKIILTLWIFWLLFCWVSFAADNSKVFDWCWPISNYKNKKRYDKLEKQLIDKWISTTWSNQIGYVSEVCYSKSRSQVIVNIPTLRTEYKKCESWNWTWVWYCFSNLNIFSYNIKNNKLSQAKLDSSTIYIWFDKTTFEGGKNNKELKYKYLMYIWNDWRNLFQNPDISTIIRSFWKRIWDYITIGAGYGDMWCYSESKFRYYYKNNIIKAESEERWCVEWDNSWYSTIKNYITKTTKKTKVK